MSIPMCHVYQQLLECGRGSSDNCTWINQVFHILVFNSENSEFLIPKPLKRGFYLAYSVMGDGGEGDSPLKTQLFSVSTIFMLNFVCSGNIWLSRSCSLT